MCTEGAVLVRRHECCGVGPAGAHIYCRSRGIFGGHHQSLRLVGIIQRHALQRGERIFAQIHRPVLRVGDAHTVHIYAHVLRPQRPHIDGLLASQSAVVLDLHACQIFQGVCHRVGWQAVDLVACDNLVRRVLPRSLDHHFAHGGYRVSVLLPGLSPDRRQQAQQGCESTHQRILSLLSCHSWQFLSVVPQIFISLCSTGRSSDFILEITRSSQTYCKAKALRSVTLLATLVERTHSYGYSCRFPLHSHLGSCCILMRRVENQLLVQKYADLGLHASKWAFCRSPGAVFVPMEWISGCLAGASRMNAGPSSLSEKCLSFVSAATWRKPAGEADCLGERAGQKAS